MKVQKLLGRKGPIAMTYLQMAQDIGITKGQLTYLLDRDYLRKKAKEKRIAEKAHPNE